MLELLDVDVGVPLVAVARRVPRQPHAHFFGDAPWVSSLSRMEPSSIRLAEKACPERTPSRPRATRRLESVVRVGMEMG